MNLGFYDLIPKEMKEEITSQKKLFKVKNVTAKDKRPLLLFYFTDVFYHVYHFTIMSSTDNSKTFLFYLYVKYENR